MDMLRSKKRANDRKDWLETKGNLATAVEPLAAAATGGATP